VTVPRWLKAWLLTAALAATTLLVARLTTNWTMVPAAVFLGALSGPFAFAVWVTDWTRVGRSVPPDTLFMSWLVGGGVAIMISGLFESQFFLDASDPGYLWVALTEEVAKAALAIGVYIAVPKYRSVEQALAFAIVIAAGFATLESMTFALEALDISVKEARRVLFERSILTPFGHLPWTGLAVFVATRRWQADGRIRIVPGALWGLGAAIGLHTTWNFALTERGWWWLGAPAAAVTTFLLFRWVLRNVYYTGPYIEPAEPDRRPRSRTSRGIP
jgi:RsiW-degrading membrane proteinase PrsW (M82 family)